MKLLGRTRDPCAEHFLSRLLLARLNRMAHLGTSYVEYDAAVSLRTLSIDFREIFREPGVPYRWGMSFKDDGLSHQTAAMIILGEQKESTPITPSRLERLLLIQRATPASTTLSYSIATVVAVMCETTTPTAPGNTINHQISFVDLFPAAWPRAARRGLCDASCLAPPIGAHNRAYPPDSA